MRIIDICSTSPPAPLPSHSLYFIVHVLKGCSCLLEGFKILFEDHFWLVKLFTDEEQATVPYFLAMYLFGIERRFMVMVVSLEPLIPNPT